VVGAVAANAQDLQTMSKNANQWVMTGRTYDLQRASPLTQITPANVKNLQAAWTMSTGVLRGHEGNPLVVGNVLYVHSAFPNKVYALDLTKEGAPQLWQFTPDQPADVIPIACCDVVNRGLAYHPSGKLYIELLSGDLLALDAKTGKQVFRVKSADYKKGETMTNAPLVVKDIVITGISGGEFGVRGRVTAFDANTGKELWRKYSTGPDADVGITGVPNANYESMKGKDLGVSTWQGDEWQRGGGTTWGWYSYDPESNTFYYGSGNPGSWNPDQRPGDNKWSMTIWARNPDDGNVKWVYQMTPHDAWDYDGVNEMVLFDQGGKKLLAHFDRNGFGYTLDRTTGKVLVANPYGPVNWAKSIDLTTGRPVEDASKRTNAKGNTEGICPAAIGFKDQQPSAYSPQTGLFYVPVNNICMDYGRRGEVLGWSALRWRHRADVSGPWWEPWSVHRLGSDEGQGCVGDQGEPGCVRRGDDDREWPRVLRHDGRLAQGRRCQDGSGPLEVQDPVGHYRQPDVVHGPRWQAVYRRAFGHRWVGWYRRGRRHRR
jgi:PQQ-dependent dehydrogenase (methanol/ethanol family)